MSNHHKYINWIFGIAFSLALTFGFEFQNFGEILVKSIWTYVAILLLSIGISFGVKAIWDLMIKLSNKALEKKETPATDGFFWHCFGAMWILHFIVFLGVFPGFFVYDAQEELMEVVTRSFNTRHPMLHVLSLGGVIQLFHKVTGSYNIGIAAFIILGMTLTVLIYAFVVNYLKNSGLGRRGGIALTLYFGLFPVLVMYSLCSVKDGFFGSFLIVVVLYLIKMIENPGGFFKKPYQMTNLVIAAILMMLFRNNGVYAFALFVFVCAFIFEKTPIMKPHNKRFVISMVYAIVAFLLINKTLLFVTNATSVGRCEILTVPIQQMARVYDYDKASLSSTEIAKISKFIPEEAMERYNPKCSDMVKIEFNDKAFSDDTIGFFKIWGQTGLKHPIAYINAFIGTSYGLWYPGAIIDGYSGNQVFTFTYGESSYFGYETEEPGVRTSFIPVIDKLYKFISLDVRLQKFPIVSLLFSPGFMLWVMLFIMGFMVYTMKGHDAIPFLLPALVILTCVFGPMSLVRYSYYLWVIVPVMIIEINIKRCYTNKL